MKKNVKDILILLLSMPIIICINSFVFLKLYTWFLLPIFKLPCLNILQSLGIILFINLCTIQYNQKSDNKDKDVITIIFTRIFILGFILLFAYILKSFI